MSLFHRLHKLVNGVGGAGNAVLGGIKDILTAPFTDDEYDGLVGSLWGITKNRLGQGAENLFGPQGVGGSIIGALPAGVRNPARSVVNPALNTLETAWREGVSEPISTAVTASAMPYGIGNPSNWREAYRIAQHRSPGQAIYLALATDDVTNEAQVTKAMNSDGYHLASGVIDAALRFTLDPTVVAGKVYKGVRAGRVALDAPSAVARYANSDELVKFNDELGKVVTEHGANASSVIRDRWFSDKDKYASSGGVISDLLASANDGGERMQVLRGLIGDQEAVAVLRERHVTLANHIERLSKPPIGQTQLPGAIQAELDALYPVEKRLARLEAETEIPKIVQRVDVNEGRIRTSITRSTFWQESAMAKPLRTITEKSAGRLVALHDGSGDIQVKRYLERSALPLEAQDAWRAKYMASANEGERAMLLTQIEDDAVRSLAELHGMTTSDVQILMEGARPNQGATKAVLSKSRAYDSKGRSKVAFEGDDGVWHEVHLPMWATQEVNFHALVDLEDVRSAVGKLGDWKLRHGTLTNAPDAFLTSFYHAWKPAQLLRFGWPIRVVGDEQLRILAKIGAVQHLRSLRTGLAGDVADTLRLFGRRQMDRIPPGLRRSPPERMARPVVRKGFTTEEGYEMEGALGAPGDMQNIYRQKVSSNASFQQLVGQEENRMLGDLRQASGNFGTIFPDSVDHGPAWEWAVNNQIGQDALGKQLLRGKTVDQAVKWMTDTKEGQKYVASMPARAKNLRAWVENNAEQVNDYLPTEELRKLALSRTATADDLVKVFPNAAERPAVHGEILMQTQGKGMVSRAIDKTVTTLYSALGKTPTDILSRNRFFDSVYRAESQRLVRLLDDGALTPETLNKVSARAREYALDQTKDLLYDLAEKSRLAEMLRFVMPFYGAWEEVLTVWAGLAVENPAFIRRMHLLWQAPEKAGIVTDENGREIEWGKHYAEGERGTQRYLTVPVPEWVKDIPGMKGVASTGSVAFNRKSFNLALNGMPGFGPVVQVPVNEIVKDRPDLEDSLKFILPFGSQNTRDLVLPAWGRRAFQSAEGDENRVFHNSVMRIYFDKMVDYNLGKRQDQPTYKEALKEAQALSNLRIFASFTLPAQPTMRSPYQPYIDAFRQARDRYNGDKTSLADANGDQRTPEEWFIDTYGAEFFPLTESLSKSVDGIPPTVEAWKARKEHTALLEKHPEYGGLIVGADGAGKFSNAVYASQFGQKVAPGSGDTQRRAKSWEEASAGPDVRLGWLEYGRAMDLIDAARVQQGYSSLNVKGASQLLALKQAITLKLAQQHPAWYDDFQTNDEGKWRKRISAFEDITADPQIANRPEMQGLKQYLDARKAIIAALSTRPSKTLAAKSNADLARFWDAIVGSLTEKNLAFADLHHRWLSNDPIAMTIQEKAKAA